MDTEIGCFIQPEVDHAERRRFSREFKIEAVTPLRERGVSAAQAGRDLGVDENVDSHV
jgi:transposase-like protein